MTALIKSSISLDGKLLTAAGKPSRRLIPEAGLQAAKELQLTIHPVIVGDDSAPTLSGLPGEFLPEDLLWELVSVTKSMGTGGTMTARYRRK
jgi:riboflavin biosynthesis pyrimidine reductase